jgi:integrase
MSEFHREELSMRTTSTASYAIRRVAESQPESPGVAESHKRPTLAPSEVLTLEAYASVWLARQQLLAEGGLIRISSLGRYQSALRAHLLPFFGARELDSITREQVDAFRMAALNVGRLNPGTVNSVVGVLRLILRSAHRDRLIDREPLSGMRGFPVPGRLVDPYDDDEVARLIQATRPKERVVVGLAALAGLRKGEAFAIRPQDIDQAGRRLRVARSLQRAQRGFTIRQRLGPPKTAAGFREVPLQSQLAQLIDEHLAHHWRANEYDLLCHGADGEPLAPVQFHVDVFAPAVAVAGLRPMRFHDLRRSFIARCVRAGIPVAQTAAWLGHSIRMTDYYYQTGHAELLESLDLLERERSR